MAKRIKLFDRPRPPRVIHIGGHKVKVRIVKHLQDDNDDPLHGAFNADLMTIYLTKSDPNIMSTLAHEIFHLCLFVSGANEGLSYSKEEGIVRALEGLFVPLLGV